MLPKMGRKAPKCLEYLGSVISLLDCAGCCFWGCGGGDHTVEYITGRVASSARAALRLLCFGFYDESLSLTRGIYEAANLLFLFMIDPQKLDEWKRCTKKERLSNFSPFQVRVKLEALGTPLPVDENRYNKLCEIAVHVTPQTKPQSHNPVGIPTTGAYFQEAGVLVSLNELAAATSLAAVPVAKLLKLEEDKRKYFRETSLKLLRSVGAVDVLSLQGIWEKLRSGSAAGKKLKPG